MIDDITDFGEDQCSIASLDSNIDADALQHENVRSPDRLLAGFQSYVSTTLKRHTHR